MKKLFAFLLVACMLLSFTMSVYAETTVPEENVPAEPEHYHSEYADPEKDAFHISDEILAQLPLKEGDQVIRVINANIFSFSEYSNIEEFLNAYNQPDSLGDIFYVVRSADGTIESYSYYHYLGRFHIYGPASEYKPHYYSLTDKILEGEVIKQVDPDIQVHYAYYLCGSFTRTGGAIYYKTNLGDYVYYFCHTQIECKPILLTAEAFHEYQKEVMAYVLSKGSACGGGSGVVADMSAYEIGSPNFNPNAPFPTEQNNTPWIIGGIALTLCLTAGTALLLLRRRAISRQKI